MSRRRKRKLRKKFAIVLSIGVLGILLICSFSGVYLYKTSIKNDTVIQNADKKEDSEKVYELSLIAVGDNLIHSSLYKDANRHANGEVLMDYTSSTATFDFTPMYKYIKEIVQNYDIGYINQETILGGKELGLSSYPTFNSPQEVGDAIIDAGFNLVSLATNHTVDKGEEGVINSCNYWKDKTSVMTSGSYCSSEDRNGINIKTVNNISYTMLNYTYGTNGLPVANDYLVNVWPTDLYINNPETDTVYQEYKETVRSDVERVRDKVDLLIVAMHWGVEYTHEPTAYEVDMAEFLASLGVDVVIGTHPHVIQPVTWIDDTLVIYSLGNFISGQYQNDDSCTNYKCVVGLMTDFKVVKTVKDDVSTITISNVENELIYTYYNQVTWSGFVVIPFSNAEIASHLDNYMSVYNTYKSVVTSMDSTMYVKDAYQVE